MSLRWAFYLSNGQISQRAMLKSAAVVRPVITEVVAELQFTVSARTILLKPSWISTDHIPGEIHLLFLPEIGTEEDLMVGRSRRRGD